MTSNLRRCANIKSKKQTDQRCSLDATHTDFCIKHYEHPTRFPFYKEGKFNLPAFRLPLITNLQRSYRFHNSLRRFKNQGPASNNLSLAENETEIFSFDPIKAIPLLFRFSFADKEKHIFMFDIRTLFHLIEKSGYNLMNPYTRSVIPKNVIDKLIKRISFLCKQKYCLSFPEKTNFSAEQLFHQNIVDICLKFDFLGYYTSPEWFELLTLQNLKDLYLGLWEMFISNPIADKNTLDSIYKDHDSLYLLKISGIQVRKEKKPLQQAILNIFDKLITTSTIKENRYLGATYCLKAWGGVNNALYANYPWLA
jgi:hypothetical protein